MYSITYRRIGIAILLGLLLMGIGCKRDTTETGLPTKNPVVSEQGTEKPQEPEITATPLPALTLMENRMAAGVSGNVYLIPLKELETMNRPKCYLMGEKLLVTSDPQWEAEETMLTLKVFSLRNGELLATAQIECEGYVTVAVEQDRIAVCDSAAGKVRILSENLVVCKEYTCEVWASYSPEEFTYAESYLVDDIPVQFRNEEYYAYFVSNYGMSYPTEDRATLMEEAMSDHRISFQIRPKLIDKMEYYSACIRDSFDTNGWPGQTRWEGLYEKR